MNWKLCIKFCILDKTSEIFFTANIFIHLLCKVVKVKSFKTMSKYFQTVLFIEGLWR